MDRIQGPEIKPQVYDQLIFNMVIKTIQWDYSFLSTNYGGQTGHPHEKIQQLPHKGTRLKCKH